MIFPWLIMVNNLPSEVVIKFHGSSHHQPDIIPIIPSQSQRSAEFTHCLGLPLWIATNAARVLRREAKKDLSFLDLQRWCI